MRLCCLLVALATAQHAGAISIPLERLWRVPNSHTPPSKPPSEKSWVFTESRDSSPETTSDRAQLLQPQSQIIPVRNRKGDTETARKLTGKFLHITDIHPDPYYKVHSSTDEDHTCHGGKGPSGYYGAETTGCDSPLTLVNATFDWLKANMRDEVDFIIWTGDSARHDNDEDIPRSRSQVIQQNEMVVKQFLHAFGKPENYDDDDPTNDFVVPIVPTLGNNDILPHNIFTKGPNYWSKKYLDVWRQFIPEAERHQFQRGGWFQVEVIPGKLAVFTLNTLYFFSSNSAADGCAVKREPGYQQFEWLRVQLDQLRQRGMKAIITGHVAPARVESKVSWEETCWQKYTLWMHQYRDIIVAGLYGHMNIDHFMLQDFKSVKKHVRHGIEYNDEDTVIQVVRDDDVAIQSATDYLQDLRGAFATIPKLKKKDQVEAVSKKKNPKKGTKHPDDLPEIGGRYGERYSLTFVSPSVVPNYFPTIRVFSYNISGLDEKAAQIPDHQIPGYGMHSQIPLGAPEIDQSFLPEPWDDEWDELEYLSDPSSSDTVVIKPKKHKRKGPKKIRFHVPKGPSKSTPPGPAYSAQPFSILSYKQYYANLTWLNNDFTHDSDSDDDENESGILKWKSGKHDGKKPKHDKPKPRNFTFEVEYDTTDDEVYKLSDLTVRSMLDLAARIAGDHGKTKSLSELSEDDDNDGVHADKGGKKKKKHKHKKKKKKKHNKVWLTFASRAFVSTVEPDDVEDLYG